MSVKGRMNSMIPVFLVACLLFALGAGVSAIAKEWAATIFCASALFVTGCSMIVVAIKELKD